jgi:hypothetical protein
MAMRTVELKSDYPSPYIKLLVSSMKNQLTMGLGEIIWRIPVYLNTVKDVVSNDVGLGLKRYIANELF